MTKYEPELSLFIWEALEEQYGLKDGKLYQYLTLRSLTSGIQKGRVMPPDIKDLPRQLASFLLEEWKLQNMSVSFLDEQLVMNTALIHNIIVDWHQRYAYLFYEGDFEQDILNQWKTLLKETKRRQSKWSKKSFFTLLLQREYLSLLNDSFRIITRTEIAPISHLKPLMETNPLRLEVDLARRLHPHLSLESHVEQLNENQLEHYLYKHLFLMEDGLRPIQRQYSLENGRIDLLAKDSDGKMVIIEVKVDSDTDLLWQESYYVQELEKEFGKGQVRFMAVVPRYEAHIMESMMKKAHCQIFIFNAVMKGTTLCDVQLQKIEEGVVAG